MIPICLMPRTSPEHEDRIGGIADFVLLIGAD
jgi:hypothetical protein